MWMKRALTLLCTANMPTPSEAMKFLDLFHKRVGIVAALMNKKTMSLLQYDRAMDSTLFELWFEQCLFP